MYFMIAEIGLVRLSHQCHVAIPFHFDHDTNILCTLINATFLMLGEQTLKLTVVVWEGGDTVLLSADDRREGKNHQWRVISSLGFCASLN